MFSLDRFEGEEVAGDVRESEGVLKKDQEESDVDQECRFAGQAPPSGCDDVAALGESQFGHRVSELVTGWRGKGGKRDEVGESAERRKRRQHDHVEERTIIIIIIILRSSLVHLTEGRISEYSVLTS